MTDGTTAAAPPSTDGPEGGRVVTLKMLGDILWFPLLFLTGFLVFYFVPFHTTAPHALPVAVVGGQATAQLQEQFDRSRPGAFELQTVHDAAAGRDRVLDRSVDAALEAGPDGTTLYVAGANGRSLTPVLQQTFEPVARAAGGQLRVVDVAPLRAGDTSGASFFYLALLFNLVPYILVMFLIQHPGFGQRSSLTLLGVVGAAVSVLVWLVVWPTGVVPVDPVVFAISFLMTQAVGWTAWGLVPLAGKWFPGVLLLLFVLLSIPSSSGAVPIHLVPRFYQYLHPVMPLGNYVSAARGVLYFGGHGVLVPVLVLFAWLALGIGLVLLGSLRSRRAAAGAARAEERAVEETAAQVEGADAVPGGVVVPGSVVDTSGAPVTRGTVTCTTVDGDSMGRVPLRENGTFALLVRAEDGQRVVVTAFGDRAGVGATVVRAAGGATASARITLTGARHTRVAEDRIDTAGAAAAAALGGS